MELITLKALLRPRARARLSVSDHRFCSTPACPIVYFGKDWVFTVDDLSVPVYQKTPVGNRIVCYCFAITEGDLLEEVRESGNSTAAQRVTDHVRAGRCACEIKNPQGSCCLGNLRSAATLRPSTPDPSPGF